MAQKFEEEVARMDIGQGLIQRAYSARMVAVFLPKGIDTKEETERWKVWQMSNRLLDHEITIIV